MFLTCLFCGGNHGNVKKRGNKYAVIYDYYDADGKRRQKWEAFGRKEDAEKFRKKIEYQKVRNTFLTPSDQTVEECLMSWASLYDKSKWSCSIVHLSWLCSAIILFRKSDGYLYRNYSRYMLKCFTTLCERKNVAAQRDTPKTRAGFLTTLRHIHTLLKTAFDKAVDWKIIEENPVTCDAPKKAKTERHIWTAEMVKQALDGIENPQLHLAVHLAFICSLRIGETVGLTWDDIDFDKNLIHVHRTLQRVSRESLQFIPQDDIIHIFPSKIANTNSTLVLKLPKTANSNRIIYLTPALRRELMLRKAMAAKQRAFAGEEYYDFNLVFALEDGFTVEPKLCEK